MPRLDQISPITRDNLLTFPAQINGTSPWTPLSQPLSQTRLALVTTAGLHLKSDRPFESKGGRGDYSYREFPTTSAAADLLQSHSSIGFGRVAIQRDLNVALPLDRLRELVERGAVGSLGPRHYSFIGALRNPSGIQEETGPEVARLLREEGVQAVLLTGT